MSAAGSHGAGPGTAQHVRVRFEAWTYSGEGGGRWSAVEYAPGPVPQAAVLGGGLWLVGGWDPSAPPDGANPTAAFLNDVWRLDLRTWAWQQVEGSAAQPARAVLRRVPVRGAAADPPSPPSRGLHSLTLAAAAPGSGTGSASAALYVYGGAPQSGSMYNDLWRLDLETGGWSWVQLDPAGAAPHSNAWLEVEVEGPAPSPRNASIMVPLQPQPLAAVGDSSAANRFLLHGGWRPFVETYNDSYIVTEVSMNEPSTGVTCHVVEDGAARSNALFLYAPPQSGHLADYNFCTHQMKTQLGRLPGSPGQVPPSPHMRLSAPNITNAALDASFRVDASACCGSGGAHTATHSASFSTHTPYTSAVLLSPHSMTALELPGAAFRRSLDFPGLGLIGDKRHHSEGEGEEWEERVLSRTVSGRPGRSRYDDDDGGDNGDGWEAHCRDGAGARAREHLAK
eukprot:XP_001695099.1 predicted protein [Chlamydomonas reinhardtii]